MKCNHQIKLCIVAFALAAGFSSCDKSTEEPIPGAGKEIKIAVDFTKWNYFSFSKGDTVATASATAAADAAWKDRTDWDIAFHMTDVRTNSGISGNGQGGVYYTNVADFNTVAEAPLAGYVTDTEKRILTAMPPQYLNCGVNSELVWTEKVGMGYEVTPKIFIVKTANGHYAKVYMKNIQSDPDNSMGKIITMEYFYQEDGSTYLATTND